MMTDARIAPYGTWRSPVTTDMLVAGGLRFGGLMAAGDTCFWVEGRASEGGRNVLVACAPDGQCRDLTAPPYNVRTRVHEYGGGAFVVDGGEAWFVNFDDQGLYHRAGDGAIRTLCQVDGLRFADFVVDRPRERLIAVVEDHRAEGEEQNYLAAVELGTGAIAVLARGHDFYASPALSPDGGDLAWLAWDHPCMPWDGTVLECAPVTKTGDLGQVRTLAGGETVSVFQPCWSPSGELWFSADPNGWWGLYRWDGIEVHAVHEAMREFGRPQWMFGMRTFGFVGERLLASYCEQGDWHLGWIDAASGAIDPIVLEWRHIDAIAFGDQCAFLQGGAPDRVGEVARLDLAADPVGLQPLRASTDLELALALVSVGEPITFPTSDGDEAHAYYYAPNNPDFEAPTDERPPLIVIGHGGPTASTSCSLSPAIQYWTTRGFAVLDVNYRGSTGYGRAYRDRLKGQWGIYDVADCVHGARALVERGRADPQRLAIRGGSAGGYTALAALTFHDTFTAGASYYGISELEVLARDTHKFESRYLDSLIGPYPEQRQRYFDRSPINFTDQLSCPLIFFQGLEDKVVPPNQAEMMVSALREKGLPVAYIPFAGEQHGFRAAATIKRTLEAELYFYGRIFGFEPSDAVEPVPIDGLD